MQTSKVLKLVLVTTALSSAVLASAATIAGAADVPPRAYKMPPPPPYYLWTGFYVGAHAGGGWEDVGFPVGNLSGFMGGGQVGYNYQIHNWVVGVEGEVSGTNIGTSVWGVKVNVDTVSTLAVRAGYAFDRWLVYGKFGAGWAHATASAGPFSVSDTGSGALFGVGAEYALGNNWSTKVEYQVIDSDFQSLKAGVNYKFGPGWPF